MATQVATNLATPVAVSERGRLVWVLGDTRVRTSIPMTATASASVVQVDDLSLVILRDATALEAHVLRRTGPREVAAVAASGRLVLEPHLALTYVDGHVVVSDGACSLAVDARPTRGTLSPAPVDSPEDAARASGLGRPAAEGARTVRFAAPPFAPLAASVLIFASSAASVADLFVDAEGYEVALPAGGSRLTLPNSARCVAVVTRAPTGVHVAFDQGDDAELAGRLVAELAVEGARADAAIQSLARLGDAARVALEATFPDATSAERRRILRAATGLVRTAPNALRLFVFALESGDPELEGHALEALLALGRPGLAGLEAATERGHVEAARRLAERAPERAAEALTVRFTTAHDDATLRALRPAVSVAAGRSAEGRARLLALAATTEHADLAAFLLAATRPDARSADAARAVCGRAADHVPSALRCLEAVGPMPLDAFPELEPAVRAASVAEAWMVRAAAYEALGRAGRLEQVVPALEDATPSVRAAGIRQLATYAPSLRRIAELARRDPDAKVRLEADRVLLDHPDAEALVRLALRDRSTRVRVGVYDALGRRGDARFAEEARAALAAMRGATPSLVAAARYLGAVCDSASVAVLRARGDAGREGSSERLRAVALAAAAALADLPGEDAHEAAARLLGPAPVGREPRCRR